VINTLATFTAALPVLVTVRFCAALVIPTFCEPKFKLAGDKVITVPFPFSSITCGFVDALSEIDSCPALEPIAVG
jgi:hypothetical protein